jgi:pSer/pThr/pTyr-binding forkhead associated (FHA) protein
MPKLIVSGMPHDIVEESITIGRAVENMIRIDDPSVSGRHAQLQLIGNGYYLNDLGSTNGTYVNGVTATNVRLRVGDRIRFGKVEARLESDAPAATQPLPEPQELEARPAEASARPVDFQNASPFPNRKKDKDPMRTGLFVAALVAFIAFVVSMIAVLTMHAPAL